MTRLVERLQVDDLLIEVRGRLESIAIASITDDSRAVRAGTLFVAVEGEHHDGNAFAAEALAKGAVGVVTAQRAETGTAAPVTIVVSDARAALSVLSHEFAGRPSERMRLVGVTGTNGKTTTTWLIHHMLTQIGRSAGLVGTIECRIGSRAVPATLTTPEPVELNRLLGEMEAAGCTEATMEVSSHALAQKRVAGIRFSAAVFTNLTRDHLDFHRTTTAYRDAKRSLFTGLDANAAAIINSDDAAAPEMMRSTAARCLTFGRSGSPSHRFDVVDSRLDGLKVTIDGDTRRYRLVGAFNAYNLTAAYTTGIALGYPKTDILDALESAMGVPGRLELFKFASGATVFVDYAHTPDALMNALTAIKDTAPAGSTIWCIFGCGGDRDPGKRPEMGKIAEAYADRVIVTSDNPRHEAPDAILDDIRDGMERPDEAEWIVDRREAIRFAGRSAASGDIVLVAGKGHEPYQVIGTNRIHFDDREEVRQWFG